MDTTKLFRSAFASVAVIAFGVGCASAPPAKSVTVSEAEGGDGMVVALSEGLARSLLGSVVGAELECGADIDGDFAALLRELDRGGRRSSATLSKSDSTVVAKRRGRSLKVRIDDRDGSRVEAELPWSLAECLLEGRSHSKSGDHARIALAYIGADGTRYEVRVD